MTTRRRFLGGALAAGAATLVPRAGRGQAAGGVLKVAIIGEPPSLDAHHTTASLTYDVTSHLYEPL
jgi:peptide/nickel transport system substrate-binding protein